MYVSIYLIVVEMNNNKNKIRLNESEGYLCSTPVPVYLISTVSKDGIFNIAPYGMVMPVSYKPLVYCIATSKKRDTYRNICDTGDFVLNAPSADLLRQVNQTADTVPPEVDEFELAGLTPIDSEKVSAPRIEECKSHLECKVVWMKEATAAKSGYATERVIITAKVVALSIDSDIYIKKLSKQKGLLNPLFYEYKCYFSIGRYVGDRKSR